MTDTYTPTEQQLRQEVEALRRERDIARAERDHARAQFDHACQILTGIHSIMYPAPFTLSDGRTMIFRPSGIDPHEYIQALSDRIRAIPDELAKTK